MVNYFGNYFIYTVRFTLPIPIMLMTPLLSKISTYKRLLASTIFYLISLIFIGFSITPRFVLVGSIFNGIGFGLALPSIRQLVMDISPKNLHTTAQGITEAFYSAVSVVIISFLSGIVIEKFGMSTLIIGCSLAQIILIFALIKHCIIVKK